MAAGCRSPPCPPARPRPGSSVLPSEPSTSPARHRQVLERWAESTRASHTAVQPVWTCVCPHSLRPRPLGISGRVPVPSGVLPRTRRSGLLGEGLVEDSDMAGVSACVWGACGLLPAAEAGRERCLRAEPPPPEAQTGPGGSRQTWARAPGSSGDSSSFGAWAGRPGRPRPCGVLFHPGRAALPDRGGAEGPAGRIPEGQGLAGIWAHPRPSPHRAHCQSPVSLRPGQGAVCKSPVSHRHGPGQPCGINA